MNAIKESTSPSGAILDSLPYVETVHEDHEEYALALIEEEMKLAVPRPMKKIIPLNFRTPTMQTEYEKLVVEGNAEDGERTLASSVQTRPKEPLQQYQRTKITKSSMIEERKISNKTDSCALLEIKSLYESERIRSLVLEVEKEEGAAIWKDYNVSLDELAAFWTKLFEQETDTVEEINFLRQQAQMQQVGPEIERLNQKYQQILHRRNQLEHAIEGLSRRTEMNNGDGKTRKRKVQVSNA